MSEGEIKTEETTTEMDEVDTTNTEAEMSNMIDGLVLTCIFFSFCF